jgi:hypothetical protein
LLAGKLQPALNGTAPSCDQIENQHGKCYYEQDVNQSPGNVQTESEKPQNQKYDKDCPEHSHHSSASLASEAVNRLDSLNAFTNHDQLDAVAGH